MKQIKVRKEKKGCKLEEPAHSGDCGFDVRATEQVLLEPGERYKMPLGIALQIPKGYYAKIDTKSGRFAKEGLVVHAGIIDSSYRGEIHAQLLNTHNCEDIMIKKGEKVAQVIFMKYYAPKVKYVKSLTKTTRGAKGFGSSGK